MTRAQLKARQGKKVSGSTQIEIDENGQAKLNTILDDIFNKVDANHVSNALGDIIPNLVITPVFAGRFDRYQRIYSRIRWSSWNLRIFQAILIIITYDPGST